MILAKNTLGFMEILENSGEEFWEDDGKRIQYSQSKVCIFTFISGNCREQNGKSIHL